MSKEQPKIDRLFQSKLPEREFQWDESYWDSMESLLDDKEKKRRGFFFWLFGIGFTTAALATFIWLYPFHSSSEDALLVVDLTETEMEKEVESNIPVAENNLLSEPAKINDKETPAERDSKANENTLSIPENVNESRLSVKTGGQEAAPEISILLAQEEELTDAKLITAEAEENELVPNVSDNTPVEIQDLNEAALVIPVEPEERLDWLAPLLPALKILPQHAPQAIQGSEVEEILNRDWRVGLHLRTSMQSAVPESWNTDWWAGFGAGVLIQHNWDDRIALQSGLVLLGRNERFAILAESRQVSFGLDREETVYRLVPENLFYLSVPFMVDLSVNRRNGILLGIESNVLIGAQGKLEEWVYLSPEDRTPEEQDAFEASWREAKESGTMAEELPSFSSLQAEEKGWLPLDDLRKLHLAASFGYRYKVMPNLDLHVLGRYRFGNYAVASSLTSAESRWSLELGLNYWIK